RLREPVRVQHRHAALELRLHLGVTGGRERDLAELVLGEPGDRERREDEDNRDRSQRRLHIASLLHWCRFLWDPRWLLAPYAEQFVEELVAYSRRAYPRPRLTRRAPPIPRPRSRDPACPSAGRREGRARVARPCACRAPGPPGRPRRRATRRRRPARDAACRTVRRG